MIKELRHEIRVFRISNKIPWLLILLLVIVLNGLFTALSVWRATLPREPLAERVRNAFSSSELILKDHLPFDARRGTHQYNDCLILQMITNQDKQIIANALGPLTYIRDENGSDQCRTLHEIVVEKADISKYQVMRYTRYWHGYNSISAALLQKLELSDVRFGLRLALYIALLLLGFFTCRGQRELIAISASITITGVFFWAVPYTGQSLCHGPGDIFVVSGITCLLFWRNHLSKLQNFVLFCAAYGAVVVYLEFLIGLLPMAMGLLFPTAYAIAILHLDQEKRHFQAWMFATTGMLAFAFGGVLTVILKQILSIYFSESQALNSFLGNLIEYIGSAGSIQTEPFMKFPPILKPFAKFIIRGDRLTYGSKLGAGLLYANTVFTWVACIYLAIRKSNTKTLSDLLAFAMGPFVVFSWVLLFQKHTSVHSGFMVRTLIVPISLGWSALAWQLIAKGNRKLNTT